MRKRAGRPSTSPATARRVRVLGQRRWLWLGVLVANGGAQAGAAIAAGLSIERTFALIASERQPTTPEVLAPVLALVLAGSAAAWLRARERVDAERLGQSYVHAVRIELHDHLTLMSPRTLQTSSQGATAMRFVGDLTDVRRWVSLGLARLVVALTVIAVTAAALARLHPALAVAVGLVVCGGAIRAVAQAPAQREAARNVRRRRARLAANVTEQIAALGVIRANGGLDRERKRFRRQSRRLRQASIERAERLGRLEATSELTATAATASVLAVALGVDLDSSSTAGALAIVAAMTAQVRGLSRVQEYRQGALVSREAIGRFLARPTTGARRGEATLSPGAGLLELADIGLDGALHGIDAIARPGRVVAVVGPNGAGKSTLLAVVAQLVEPTAGTVRLDGVDLGLVRQADVSRAVGLVSADLPLLRGSIRDNLVYGWPDVSEDDLRAVVRLCGLDDRATLPDGLDTAVREQGRALSAGQRQRVQLGRALLGRPRVLLLDEVDANLDNATLSVVDDVIGHFGGTCLIVTHRRERAERADEVWFLERGRLVAAGPPEKILHGDGPGARLFDAATASRGEGAVTPAGADVGPADAAVATAGPGGGGR